MPLLDIATSQPCSCFRDNRLSIRSATQFHNKLAVDNDRRLGYAFSWKALTISEKVNKNFNLLRVEVCQGGLMIKAVATLEISRVTPKTDRVKEYQNTLSMNIDLKRSNSGMLEPQSSNEDSTKVNEREKLRRMRISNANKGNTPWNKGRKHSPETIQRIKERTRIAMQDPKVKMKLVNLGHAQDEETRIKIGIAVRLGWERRREKLMLQETCHFEWQNLIAVAARKGLLGEEELQWDSYKTLRQLHEQEWLQSVEQRKRMARPKGSKRASKSAEQRRKISEAISAKWKDPGYRSRVWSGLAKYHGILKGVERKPKTKSSGKRHTQNRSSVKDQIDSLAKDETTKSQIQVNRLKRRHTPSYKDPLASSKLEMLKNIKARRAAVMNKKSEAITNAKLLIAEAEKAARTLESAAENDPFALASLIESRMLIAEAIQHITSIEEEDALSFESDNDLPEALIEPATCAEEKINADFENMEAGNHIKVNGIPNSLARDPEAKDFSFNKDVLPHLVNGNSTNSSHDDLLKTANSFLPIELNDTNQQFNVAKIVSNPKPNPNGSAAHAQKLQLIVSNPKPYPNGSAAHAQKLQLNGPEFQSLEAEARKKQTNIIKKWVRGRLVEVAEET